MPAPPGPRPPLAPRQPRLLHAGPRVRILEVALLLHVVIVFLAGFLAWVMWQVNHQPVLAAVMASAGLWLATVDVRRFLALRRLQHLARHGLITNGQVVDTSLTRFSRAPRADRVLPRSGLPFYRSLEVIYVFLAEDGEEHSGRFQTSVDDEGLWNPGRDVEIFYLADDPGVNVTSLVLRWYFRLGGSLITDEVPSPDFNEEDVEVEWSE